MPTEPLRGPVVNAVDVWLLHLDLPWIGEGELRSLLSPEEIERANRFSIEKPRREFIAARGCLRLLLSCYLGMPPRSIQFHTNASGKPYLANEKLHFNVSHTGEIALIAVARNRVGIDIEELRPMPNAEGLVERFFSENERRQFEELPHEIRNQAFFRGWTGKEALLKAVGVGIVDLESCAVDLDPQKSAKIVRFDHLPAENHCWSLTTWPIIEGYIASVALEEFVE